MPRTLTAGLCTSIGLLLLLAAGCGQNQPQPGSVQDEALQVKRTADTFTAAGVDASGHDYLHDMDGGIALSPAEVEGRNTWIVWTGGNDRFWDVISVRSAGALDFLKTLSSNVPDSNPPLPAGRHNRW